MSPSRSDSWDATGGASIVCSAFPSIGRTSGDIDSLDVDELPDAIAGELAPITALLHAPEGEARVGSHDLVHKDSAALDPLDRDTLTAREIAGQDTGSEAEHRIVGSGDGRLVVLDWDDRRYRTEQLLFVGRHAAPDIRQHGRRIVRPGAARDLAAEQASRAHCDASRDLGMQRISQVVSRKWSELRVLAHGITHLGGTHALDEQLFEALPDFVRDNEALGRDAALAGIQQAPPGAHGGRELEIRVLEDEVGIAPAELEDRLLEHGGRLARDRPAGWPAPGEGHRSHQRILDDRCDLLAADQQRSKQVLGRSEER